MKEQDLPLPRVAVERLPEVEAKRCHVLSADIEAHGHTGGCSGCATLASHGGATKPHSSECRERIRTIFDRTLTGEARMSAYTGRVAKTKRVNQRKKVRVERGARDVPMERSSEERLAERHAVASGEYERVTTRREQNEGHPHW